jgi:hypothetical protein
MPRTILAQIYGPRRAKLIPDPLPIEPTLRWPRF